MSSANVYTVDGFDVIRDYGDVSAEHAAIREGAALFDHRLRGLIQVTGKDRAAWLNNLVTNQVKTLEPGTGNYAFALNVKGRILFDLNMLVLPDALWLDIDRRLIPKAMAHFDRYIIAEDVQLRDRSSDYVHFTLFGPHASQIVDALGATELVPADATAGTLQLASASATLVQKNRLIVRQDLGACFGAELYVEAPDATACWNRLLEIGAPIQLRPAGQSAVDIVRIEAGVPASVEDIDEEVLPAETRQLLRGVSFKKGCYLGQEVVERMRSHNVLARKLMGFRFSGPPPVPAPLQSGGAEVGRVTSAVFSPTQGWVGLGYLKASHATAGTTLDVGGGEGFMASVSELPFLPAGGSI